MSFEVKTLEQQISWDDFESAPRYIVGQGQRVYWKGCFVKVFASSNRHVAVQRYQICDGQGVISQGTDIFLGGKGGIFKEVKH